MVDQTPTPARLKTLHVSLRLGFQGGGVAAYVHGLVSHLTPGDVESTLFSTDIDPVDHQPREPRGWPEMTYSPKLWGRLPGLVEAADVVHLHGLRTLLGWRTRVLAQRIGRPLVVSPHGQLHPWLLAKNRWRKRLIDRLWLRRTLSSASLLLAMSQGEADDIRAVVPDARIAHVPIGIDAADYTGEPDRAGFEAEHADLRGRRWLVYCSTISPRKGLGMLIEAWAQVWRAHPDWRLLIAGRDISGYGDQLQAEARANGVESSVIFLGEVDEPRKRALVASADLTILPTFSEAFGISVLEAMASGVPMLTTTGAPWPEVVTHDCGWRVEIGVQPLTAALHEALACDASTLAAKGANGRRLVQQHYTWEATAQAVTGLYRGLITQDR